MLGKYIKKVQLKKGEYNVYLRNSQDIEKVLFFFKYNINSQFKLLMDICGIDNMQKYRNRFEINYLLLSVKYKIRLRIKLYTKNNMLLSSINSVPIKFSLLIINLFSFK